MNDKFIIKTKEDVIRRLLILDEKIGELQIPGPKIKFVIFGGAAFLLKTQFRPTSDIDVYMLQKTGDTKIEQILNEIDINTNIQRILEMPPREDFEERMERLNVDFQNIDVRVASAYDLIISKLFSTRGDKDAIDLIRTDLIDQVDELKLRELWEDLKSYSIFHNRYNDLDDIIRMRQEYKDSKQ